MASVQMRRWNASHFFAFTDHFLSFITHIVWKPTSCFNRAGSVVWSPGNPLARSPATSSSKGTTFTLHKLWGPRLTQTRRIKAPRVHFTASLLKQEGNVQTVSSVCSSPHWTQTHIGRVRVHRRCTRGPRDKTPRDPPPPNPCCVCMLGHQSFKCVNVRTHAHMPR